MSNSIKTSVSGAVKSFFRVFAVTMCAAVVGCAATKPLERTTVQTDADVAVADTAAYSEQVAGTVRELYGDSAEGEQSQAYRDAIAENPALRYIIVYFDFNQVDIKTESREVLQQHAAYLSQHSNVEVKLEGHADKRGSSGYNLALGERRALSVKNFLEANGVQGFQTSTISYGEERPALEGDGEEAYAKNRRVELIYR